MNCYSCSKNIKKEINCDKCNKKFCSDSCLAFHFIFYHNEEHNHNEDNDFNNSNNNIIFIKDKKSPYITNGIFLKEIKYESMYNIKNFQHQLVNGKPKLLGYGSFGKVFLEINKLDKKFYAIKHMEKKRIYKALKTLDPIYSEINIQSKISHPNIVKILFANESEKYFDIVLEYAKKGNLFYYIQKNNHLSESNSFKIFIQIVNAIYFLHKNSYIHRDIKPENILLFDDNVAKLCDFGWCVKFQDEPRNTFCGTTEYMAPEMVNQKMYGKEIDIWSLGILLYEMLHGHSPFKPNKSNFNDRDVINNIRFQKSIVYNNKLSDECVELMNHLIDKNIKRRYTLDDILNSTFVKNFEKLGFLLPIKNKIDFEKINLTNRTINTSRANYSNNDLSEKNNNDEFSKIHRINTSNYESNILLNKAMTIDNTSNKNYKINREYINNNYINISKTKRSIKEPNNCFYKSISQPKIRLLNPKFSSPKVEKINKNRLQKEEDFENDNLSSIFNDHSVFNNKKISQSSNRNYLNPPTININILLNEINVSSINNDNYEKNIFKKIFKKESNNNSNIIRNSNQTTGGNSNTNKIRENNFIKKQINIFTSNNCNIKNFNELNSNNGSNNFNNIPISIRNNNNDISNISKINEMKIKNLINYFDSKDEKKKEIEKEKGEKKSFSYLKVFNINNKEEKLNNNNNAKGNNIDINQRNKIKCDKVNINPEIKNNLEEALIETNNYNLIVNSLENSIEKNNKESDLNNIEIIKTPKKNEDKNQILPKIIFSNLKEELDNFNIKKKN